MTERTERSIAPGNRSARRSDLVSLPLGRTIWLFMLPILGQNILQSLNGSASVFWVSHVLGQTALAAIVNAAQIMFLMLGLIFGISAASSILIAQSVGSGDLLRTKKIVGSCTVFFLIISTLMGVVGFTCAPAMLRLLGASAEIRSDAIAYLRVIFAALPFLFFASYLMAAQRGAGDTRTPFYFALLQIVVDVILNPILIIGIGPLPKMGIVGSAAASLISQVFALALMVLHLYRKNSPIVLHRSEFAYLVPDTRVVRVLLVKGTAMGFQMIVSNLAAATMMSAVNRWGTATISAYGAAMQICIYVQMPAIAIGAALSAISAQNVGAGRMDRVNRAAWIGAGYAVGLTFALILLLLAAERLSFGIFLPPDSPALPIAIHLNRIVLWSFLGLGVAMPLSGVFRSTGAVWPPLLFMIISMFGVRIPLAFGLASRWGPDAIWFSFPIGAAIMVLLTVCYYFFGNWRTALLLNTLPRPRDVNRSANSWIP